MVHTRMNTGENRYCCSLLPCPELWAGYPVTAEAAGSSPVDPAILFKDLRREWPPRNENSHEDSDETAPFTPRSSLSDLRSFSQPHRQVRPRIEQFRRWIFAATICSPRAK